MKRIEGRKGTPAEFVEFRPYIDGPYFVAQLSKWLDQPVWFVYEVGKGKKCGVKTLAEYETKRGAVRYAEKVCREYEQSH